jgi:hypothetical protein
MKLFLPQRRKEREETYSLKHTTALRLCGESISLWMDAG